MALPQPDRMSGDFAPDYVRQEPEQTLMFQLVEQYWPEFQSQLSETGRFLPRHVTREFKDRLACGRLVNGFLRVRFWWIILPLRPVRQWQRQMVRDQC